MHWEPSPNENSILKISLITVVRNRVKTIGDTIDSVRIQNFDGLEYIVIDAVSDDGTSDVVAENSDLIQHCIREKDNGVYDALNKGIKIATGDVIGVLHADDCFASPDVLQKVASKFEDDRTDFVYGDLVYVSQDLEKVVRYWKSGLFSPSKLRYGWMPPHPTCYIRKSCFENFGAYRDDLTIAADYELLVRMLTKEELRVDYLPEILVKMRVGGLSNSSLKHRQLANYEDSMAWKINGYRVPFGLRFTKPLRKLGQFLTKPPNELFQHKRNDQPTQ